MQEVNWAAEHLQTIRTLMERSAVYRRALAPIMTLAGVLGTLAATTGLLLKIDSPRSFIAFWLSVAVIAVVGSFFLVRLQAVKAREPFWSPPTRRVSQASFPPLAAGFIFGAIAFFRFADEGIIGRIVAMVWLPLGWIVLFGCALSAAGFFTPRGINVFGWTFIFSGCALFALDLSHEDHAVFGHCVMGFFFGVLHLAYGGYLYFTEKRRNET